jgi:RimJ/RimL family protein N-acetyltransferase
MLGFLRFCATRLFRVADEYVFVADTRCQSSEDRPNYSTIFLTKETVGSSSNACLLSQLRERFNDEYVRGVKNGDICAIAVDNRNIIAGYAFVLFDTPTKQFLQLEKAQPLIANCYTTPALRGRGIYPRLLRTVRGELGRLGYKQVFISCSPKNLASIAGILKAGFEPASHVTAMVVCSRVLARHRSEELRPILRRDGWPAD